MRNDTAASRLAIHFPLPTDGGSYADLTFRLNGKPIDTASVIDRDRVVVDVPPGGQAMLDVAYRSRGVESWVYAFKKGIGSVNNFTLTMTTNFKPIDFPPQTLLPVTETPAGDGWRLQWKYGTLVTAEAIGMVIPYPLQPLLFAYLVDRIPLLPAFVICSLTSMFLTVTYLRLVVGWRFAAIESGAAQLIYLILFSYALFNEGWSGLTITIGAIITLFVAMQATGRIRWSERLAAQM